MTDPRTDELLLTLAHLNESERSRVWVERGKAVVKGAGVASLVAASSWIWYIIGKTS